MNVRKIGNESVEILLVGIDGKTLTFRARADLSLQESSNIGNQLSYTTRKEKTYTLEESKDFGTIEIKEGAEATSEVVRQEVFTGYASDGKKYTAYLECEM